MGWLWTWRGKAEWIADRVRRPVTTAPGARRAAVFVEAARHDPVAAGGFLVLGGLTAAALNVAIPPHWVDSLAANLVLGILVMALLAVILALCSEADATITGTGSRAAPGYCSCRCWRSCYPAVTRQW